MSASERERSRGDGKVSHETLARRVVASLSESIAPDIGYGGAESRCPVRRHRPIISCRARDGGIAVTERFTAVPENGRDSFVFFFDECQ